MEVSAMNRQSASATVRSIIVNNPAPCAIPQEVAESFGRIRLLRTLHAAYVNRSRRRCLDIYGRVVNEFPAFSQFVRADTAGDKGARDRGSA
jgi:hypothetical protein